MGLFLIVVLIVAPLAELFVILRVASVIGGWETLALLMLLGFVGAWLIKYQGLATLARIGEAMAEGRPPGREMVDGLLIMVAGALMLAPGFVGDVFGFLLLIPPTRALVRAPITKRLAKGGGGRFFTAAGTTGGGRFVGTFRAGSMFDATGRESNPDRPRLDP